MYENKHQPLAPKHVFYQRVVKSFGIAMIALSICLAIGIVGYHYVAGIEWVDSLHNSSMILGGMGPVVEIKNFWGKIFSSIYALFCGVALLTNVGVLLAPLVHRFLHKLHVVDEGA